MEGLALGLSLGISIGISTGIATGGATGVASERKKLRKQIRKAIDDKEISIQDKNGEALTIKALFECLDKNYKKV